ncbi:hypothetical protein BU23DRAFT_78247 [Bimuria novae-zelandiae CBS 107.79]|uniref:Uncharacterized protein n=1 Tax=Bimuria novae-zelandiae CBS 107.79 TaxID=1447943 RepID=A0A6A5UH27_9PLEO|nr:hypothetical protein BU23DRAFT_78247 [Bimuria novae-zelandiae CBS 107.79]
MCSRFRPTAKGLNAKATPLLAFGSCASSDAESSSSVLMAYLNVCVSRFPRIPRTSEHQRHDDNTFRSSKADPSKTPNGEESPFW